MTLARSLALETKDGIDALTSSFESFRFGKAQHVPPVVTVADQSCLKTRSEKQSYHVFLP